MTPPPIIALLTATGALLGGALPWLFDRIPAGWLTEYGEEPGGAVLEPPRIDRRWSILTAVLFGAAAAALGATQGSVVAALMILILFTLGVITASDALYTIVPDQAVIAMAVLGFAAAAVRGMEHGDVFAQVGSHLLGAVLGAALIFAVGYAGSRIAGRDAMGFGDVKLAAAMGAVLGFPQVLYALVIAVLIGGVVYGVLMASRRLRHGSSAPFGPFLAIATALMLVAAPQVNAFVRWYVSLLGGGS